MPESFGGHGPLGTGLFHRMNALSVKNLRNLTDETQPRESHWDSDTLIIIN